MYNQTAQYHSTTQKGFTLIELCVVLVIVGIITAIASLAFYRADAQRGMVALTTFNNGLIAMREQAILRQQSLGLYLTDNGYNVYEIHRNQNGDIVRTPIPNNSLNMSDAFAGRWELDMKNGAFMTKTDDGMASQPDDAPIAAITADGQITPMTFTFGPHQGLPWWSVAVNASGVAKVNDLRTKS